MTLSTQFQATFVVPPFQAEAARVAEIIEVGHQPHIGGAVEETIPGVWARFVISDDGDAVPVGDRSFQ